MNLRHLAAGAVKRVFDLGGYVILPKDILPERWTMQGAMKALAQRGLVVNTVVDIGASTGEWSGPCMEYFPESDYLLIEAQHVHESALSQFAEHHPNAHVIMAAAGREQGTIYFDATDPMGGQASYTPYAKNNIVVPMTTVDSEVERLGLKGPFLLKFDTHGFEIPILEGAQQTLNDTVAIVMECYNFRIAPEALLFNEMCNAMHNLGFKPIDLIDPSHRPIDGALWQMDIVFLREDRPEFKVNVYD